ncbi:aminoacetone oxidase family FAD-binding enzyme [Butyrivibrio sp. X503]|uniref:aminoacetone oxidase family FAD-binding enzyme n=1 Tax=Butyrivibrio sp. X503 TaxID=2364878 RepID=UPI000EA8A3D6|nr:aminoacetone oxidase family FAD-binding enzyme [Butyrivibrio sp. X503]RKM57284.1 aminoacetone oxidase family FAD-binding enzyme [Butyrivibrio sp. X503]
MSKDKKRIVVAGGGAAGMCAAVCAARSGAEVTVLEKNNILGKKLSMTGNGRCNLTNLKIDDSFYNAASRARMKTWLEKFGPLDTIEFFRSLGIVTMSEEGYVYPVSEQAISVVKALENELIRLGVSVVYNSQLKSIEHKDATYSVKTSEGLYECDKVIIATGSLSGAKTTMSTGDGYYICKKLGMNVKDTFPALVGFKTADEDIMPAAGVRSNAEISFYLGEELLTSEKGEVQLLSDGISGIPVMQASRDIIRLVSENKLVYALLDLYPEYDEDSFDRLINEMLRLRDNRSIVELLSGFGNSNINEMILKRMKLSPTMKVSNISESMLRCIFENYRKLKFNIKECSGYLQSQVTTGGISLGDINDDFSFEKDDGIYVIGELVDVDGRCGGYNLQFAWTSGYIAGNAAAI